MTKTTNAKPDVAELNATAQALAEQAHAVEGQINLARDRMFIERQERHVAHARKVLDDYLAQRADLEQEDRDAEQAVREATLAGRWPGAEWIAWRSCWHRREAIVTGAINASSVLRDAGQPTDGAPSIPLTRRETDLAAYVADLLEQAAADAGQEHRAALNADLAAALGPTVGLLPPGVEEFQVWRDDGALLRVEQNNNTGQRTYTVLIPAPEPVEDDAPEAA